MTKDRTLDRWVTCLVPDCGVAAIPTTVRCLEHIVDDIRALSPLAVAEAFGVASVLLYEHDESFYGDARLDGAYHWLLNEKAWTEVDWLDQDMLGVRAGRAVLPTFPSYINRAALEWLHHEVLWS